MGAAGAYGKRKRMNVGWDDERGALVAERKRRSAVRALFSPMFYSNGKRRLL